MLLSQGREYWNVRTIGIPLIYYQAPVNHNKPTTVVKERDLCNAFTELIKSSFSFFNELGIHIALKKKKL